MTDIHDAADLVSKALLRAWELGQTYWQQENSAYPSQWKKVDVTQATFAQLVEDTRAALTSNSGAQPAPDSYATGINAVAAMLQSKADEYAKEHGHDDMGGLSFGPGMGGEIKMDYYTNLIELVDDVRTMLADASDGWKAIEARVTGAQPTPSAPELLESLRCACNYIDKLGGVSQQYRAVLAASPKPEGE